MPGRPQNLRDPARWLRRLLGLLSLLALSACVSTPVQPTPTLTPIPPTVTATFPFPTLAPTATEIGVATPLPPPGPLETAGEVVYQTDFSAADDWPLGQDSIGAVSLIEGSLSVVLPGPGFTRLVSSPAPARMDFILDVDVRTAVCRGIDEYGVVFRQTDDGGALRFTLTCQGGMRLRRTTTGSSRAVVPFQEREAAVNPGAPADNRLTVRAHGSDLDFYLNGAQVLQASDAQPQAGTFALIVTSASDSPQTTVLFEDFTLYDWELQSTPPAGD